MPKRNYWGELVDAVVGAAALVRTAERNEVLAAMEAEARAEAALPPPRALEPGDVFRCTAKTLHAMYSVGAMGLCRAPDERWTVVACACDLCDSGRFVAADTGRHFARAGVERCLRAVARAQPATEAETAAFLAAELAQLGVDRRAGTVVPL